MVDLTYSPIFEELGVEVQKTGLVYLYVPSIRAWPAFFLFEASFCLFVSATFACRSSLLVTLAFGLVTAALVAVHLGGMVIIALRARVGSSLDVQYFSATLYDVPKVMKNLRLQ
jgi:hypothetical protein